MPRISVQGIHFYYETSGQGEPLLFLHGLGSSTRDWEAQIPFFSGHYQVITVDMRGHGKSGKPPGPYSIRLFAEDTARLIRALNTGPVHAAGISMGGMIAFQLAVSNPELVRTLTIVNSAPELVIRKLREHVRILFRKIVIRLMGMRKLGEILAANLFPEPGQEPLRRKMAERWAENDRRAYMDAFRALVGWSVSRNISEIECPVLVMTADQDYTPVSFKQAYTARMKRAELVVIPHSRHLTPVDQPEHFNAALLAFLSKHA